MSRRALSGDQFRDKLTDPEGWGGYSVRPHTGEEPTSGHMVSRWGHEAKVEGVPAGIEIENYLDTHDEHFRENPNSYHGAWIEGGSTYLDESMNLPTKREAIEYGRENAQIAAYDVEAGKAYTIPAKPRMRYAGTLLEGLSSQEKRAVGEGHREALRMRQDRSLRVQQAAALAPRPSEPPIDFSVQQTLFDEQGEVNPDARPAPDSVRPKKPEPEVPAAPAQPAPERTFNPQQFGTSTARAVNAGRRLMRTFNG